MNRRNGRRKITCCWLGGLTREKTVEMKIASQYAEEFLLYQGKFEISRVTSRESMQYGERKRPELR